VVDKLSILLRTSKGQIILHFLHLTEFLRWLFRVYLVFCLLLKSQYMEKVSKTSERLGANMDLKTSNIISGKDVCFIRIYLFIRKEYPTGKHTSTTKPSKTDLKLFTRRFIHCVKLHYKSKSDLILHQDFGSIPTSLMRAGVEPLMTYGVTQWLSQRTTT